MRVPRRVIGFTLGADCAGVDGGDALEDRCEPCDADPTNDCTEDVPLAYSTVQQQKMAVCV